jgi:hypothetical protein
MMNDPYTEPGDFREVITMNYLKTFAAGSMALMLAISATAARGQTAPSSGVGSTVSATQIADAMDQEVAQKISQAWSEGKDANAAVAFQENGEIALSEGNPQQARRCFEAAEHELTGLQLSPVGAPSSSAY